MLCRWQIHRALRMPDILDRILTYLSPDDIKSLLLVGPWLIIGRFCHVAHREDGTKNFAMSNRWIKENSKLSEIDHAERIAQACWRGMFANHFRHRWLSRRKQMGCPISDAMTESDAWASDAFVLQTAGLLTTPQHNLVPYGVGDPRTHDTKADLPDLAETIVPRCTDCFRYMPMVHYFLSFDGAGTVAHGTHDPVDRSFIADAVRHPHHRVCYDCLDRRAPMLDIFSAWGLLAKLIAPAHCSYSADPAGFDACPVENDDIERHASVLGGVKSRSRKQRMDERSRSGGASMKRSHRLTSAIAGHVMQTGEAEDSAHRIFCALLAAPKTVPGCPWDPTVSPHFVHRKTVEEVPGPGPVMVFETETVPAVGQDPVPTTQTAYRIGNDDNLQRRGSYIWDYDLASRMVVKGFGLESKQRRQWLNILLTLLPRRPMMVPDGFYARTMSVFGVNRHLVPCQRFPLSNGFGPALLDRMLCSKGRHDCSVEQPGRISIELENAYSMHKITYYTAAGEKSKLWADPMAVPSATLALHWPPTQHGISKRFDYASKLLVGSGELLERYGCVHPKGQCAMHQITGSGPPGALAENVPSKMPVPFPHGGSRLWFVFESDVRALAQMFAAWMSMDLNRKPFPPHVFLERMRKVFEVSRRGVSEAWSARVMSDSNTDPFWSAVDRRLWPLGNDLYTRVALSRACLGQEFHESSSASLASPWPWIFTGALDRAWGLYDYDTLEAYASDHVGERGVVLPDDTGIPFFSGDQARNHGCWGGAPRAPCDAAFSPEIDRRMRHRRYCETDTMYNWFEHAHDMPYIKGDWELRVESMVEQARLAEEEKQNELAQKFAEAAKAREAKIQKHVDDAIKSMPAQKRKRARKEKKKKPKRPSKRLKGPDLAEYLAKERVLFAREWSAGIEGYTEEQKDIVFRSWLSAKERGKRL